MNSKKLQAYFRVINAYLLKKLTRRNYIILACILIGIVAGLAAVVMKVMVHWVEEQVQNGLGSHQSNYIWLFLTPIIGIVLSVMYEQRFLGGRLIKGITKILYAITRRKGELDSRDMYGHLVTSALTVGMGGSAGLEAPIVLTGSAIGSNISTQLQLGYKERTLLLACGASAGISAIFNAPIAGVIFAAEVLLAEISIPVFVPLLISAATASVLSQFFFHDRLFALMVTGWRVMSIPLYFLLGISCGFVSVYMTRMTHFMERKLSTFKLRMRKAIVGGAMLGLLIVIFPPLYGEGYTVIEKLMNGNENLLLQRSLFGSIQSEWMLLLFLTALAVMKVIATSLTIGSGGNGGIFAGSLFTGALTGFVFSRLVSMSGMMKLAESNFVAVGMAGVIAGVVHAPLTGIFLIAEITGGYSLFVPLMIVVAMSYFISRRFDSTSVYTRPLQDEGTYFQADRDTFLLNSIDLKDILEANIETVPSTMPVQDVIKHFIRSKQNIFPVIDEQKKFAGIVLLEDLKDLLFDQERSSTLIARDVAIRPPQTLVLGEKMADVMHKFDETWVWKLPVLSEKGAFIGFVSKKKIFTKYRELLKLYSHSDVVS
ncbi:MAG: chloride channel protein [Saprospiraceae bacterium]|nr:chloride channel protein [Saprospiraceae bacterium]MCF8249657.1 chloride channel protein [Saprospiraceae bacterium]MCF8279815.1 chloride channel protein [Bacteroidales bacterium]MCF8312356.1 chloride channel protein [Saprospiraceae bacterium]MCF8440647.1 chloride channel protein [Saprospiraceae bacterium]